MFHYHVVYNISFVQNVEDVCFLLGENFKALESISN